MTTKRNFNWRPNWLTATLGVAIGAVIAGAVVLAPMPVQAVHGTLFPFEIDGNLVSNSKLDWADVDFVNDATFIPDAGAPGSGKELSAYAGSNKDIDLIETWEYASSKVTPDKDNITNAYALTRDVDVDGTLGGVDMHQVIYFGADRYSNNGDAALGFWFFQSEVGPGPNGKFIGKHIARSATGPGDVLVQVDFSPNPDATKPPTFEIQIFEWVGAGGSHGALDELEFTGTKGDIVCIEDTAESPSDHPDSACATTNPITQNAPWAYEGKDTKFPPNVFPKQTFFEGGIDITELLGEICFATYLAETRSSHSETAELKDFASGPLESCSVQVSKDCVVDSVAPGVGPAYNATTELYETVHKVRVENDGGGALHDVAIQDNSIGTDLSCSIVAISGDGTAPAPALTLPKVVTTNVLWIEIADTLPKGGVAIVELFCKSTQNAKQNTVSVRAAGTPGGTATITDLPYSESSDDVADCGVNLPVNMQLNKFCANEASEVIDSVTYINPLFDPVTDLLAVTLNASNQFKPRVCVDIVLTNTSVPAQKMVVDSFVDDEGFSLVPSVPLVNLMSAFQTANNTNGTACGGAGQNPCNVLAPNETVSFARCYNPQAPDGGATNPGLAEYTDTVTVNAHGITSLLTFEGSASATCGLCPDCPCE